MSITAPGGSVRASVSGHAVDSIVAANEPVSQRRRALADLESALPSAEDLHRAGAEIRAVATTPDFHPGKPVPVGVVVDVRDAVLPHMIGADIGCGMRMLAIEGATPEDVSGVMPELKRWLRRVYFQGGRDVALTGRARHGLLLHGLAGLLEASKGGPGLLGRFDHETLWDDLDRTSETGGFDAGGIEPGFRDFTRIDDDPRHDAILGSIGGGNHFVEFGRVAEIADGAFARAAGVRKDSLTVVVHSGSLDFGQHVAAVARDAMSRNVHLPDRRVLPLEGELAPAAGRYVMGMRNAANVAFGNRFLLGLCAIHALRLATGKEIVGRLVYDSPHNLAWAGAGGALHRKGACPAGMPSEGPYAGLGEPVVVPGSMGDSTWLMAGTESALTMGSCAHGAGRRLSRQEARRQAKPEGILHVVGPVDPDDPVVRGRRDVLAEIEGRLAEEAPQAYRPVADVVSPLVDLGVVRPVARIAPIVSMKG